MNTNLTEYKYARPGIRRSIIATAVALALVLSSAPAAFAADGDQDTGTLAGRTCRANQTVYMWSTGTAAARRHYINNGQQIGYWNANTVPTTYMSQTGLVSILNYRVYMHRLSITQPATLTSHGTGCITG